MTKTIKEIKPKKKYEVIRGLEYNKYYQLYRETHAAKNKEIQKRYYEKNKAAVKIRQAKYRLRRQQKSANDE